MSSFVGAIIMAMDLLGNFTKDPARVMVGPYIALLGDFFYGFVIMGVVAIIYVNTEGNTRMVTLAIWSLSSVVVASLIIHEGLALIIGVIAGIVVGAIVYKAFIAKSEY